MFRLPLISFSPSINTDCEWDFPRALSGENHISYCKLIFCQHASGRDKKKREKYYAATTNQFHPPVSILHSQLPVRVNATDAAATASALARMRVHCGSLRRANFASPARQAYFAYWRAERPFDVVTTKPPRAPPWFVVEAALDGGGGKSGGEAVAFDSPLTVSYRLG